MNKSESKYFNTASKMDEAFLDLLSESIEYMNEQFLNYKPDLQRIVPQLKDCPLDELYLITPKYLTPYLNYIKENKRLFKNAMENAGILRLRETYGKMFSYVFTPILERFQVPAKAKLKADLFL